MKTIYTILICALLLFWLSLWNEWRECKAVEEYYVDYGEPYVHMSTSKQDDGRVFISFTVKGPAPTYSKYPDRLWSVRARRMVEEHAN